MCLGHHAAPSALCSKRIGPPLHEPRPVAACLPHRQLGALLDVDGDARACRCWRHAALRCLLCPWPAGRGPAHIPVFAVPNHELPAELDIVQIPALTVIPLRRSLRRYSRQSKVRRNAVQPPNRLRAYRVRVGIAAKSGASVRSLDRCFSITPPRRHRKPETGCRRQCWG